MNANLARLLTRLYPRAWRDRYGEEFEALLADAAATSSAVNIIRSAIREHTFPTQRGPMTQAAFPFSSVLRKPSAFLPLVMSLTALTIVLCHIALFGAAREPDEGAAAHLWQLLMGLQLPVLGFFVIKWLPRAPKQTLYVMGLQAGAVLASLAPVYFLNL
jgi:hypothetical protein